MESCLNYPEWGTSHTAHYRVMLCTVVTIGDVVRLQDCTVLCTGCQLVVDAFVIPSVASKRKSEIITGCLCNYMYICTAVSNAECDEQGGDMWRLTNVLSGSKLEAERQRRESDGRHHLISLSQHAVVTYNLNYLSGYREENESKYQVQRKKWGGGLLEGGKIIISGRSS